MLILCHDPEVVLMTFNQTHDLVLCATDKSADWFPVASFDILFLHNIISDMASSILLQHTHKKKYLA